jgi:O-antigen/teichoic acid export membrane protein
MSFDLDKSIEGSLVNFGFLSFSRVLAQIIGLFVVALITRKLGPALYGKMNVVLMVTQFLYLVTVSWTALGYTRYSILYSNEGKSISEVFWGRSFLVLIVITLTSLLLMVGKSHLLNYLELPSLIVNIVLLHVFSRVATDYTNQMAQVNTQFKKISILQLIEKGLILILIWLWAKDLITVLWCYIVAALACRIYFLISATHKFYCPFRLNLSLFKKLLRFSYPLFLVSFGGFIFAWVDIAIIKHFFPFHEVGIYSLAYTGFGALEAIFFLMPTVLTPILVSLAFQKRDDLTDRFIQRVLPQISYLWGFLFIFLALISLWGIPLAFGPAFSESAHVFLVLLICLNFAILNVLGVPIFVGYNMVSRMVLINFSASVINFFLDLVLVPWIGIMGAAVATTFSYCCITASYYALIKKRFKLVFTKVLLFLGITCFQIVGLLLSNDWRISIVITLTAAGIYISGGRYLGVFLREDKGIYAPLEMPGFLKRTLIRICENYGSYSNV